MIRGGGYRGRGGSSFGRRGGRNRTSSTRPKGAFVEGKWLCNCSPRLPAEHFKVKKESRNQGRWFYTCQNQETERCDFFLWDEEAKPREEAAVLSNGRAEVLGRVSSGSGEVQEGWNAGRGLPTGRGLFAPTRQQQRPREDTSSTDSSSSLPPHRLESDTGRGGGTGDFFGPRAERDEQNLANVVANAADTVAPKTPDKAQRPGVYGTPVTNNKRKLPWLEEESGTRVTKTGADFATPSKRLGAVSPITESSSHSSSIEMPKLPPFVAPPSTPSPPSRHKDALSNPADYASSLTAEALAALSTVMIPPSTLSHLRSILSRHDLKTQGITKGRDISRLALKAKDAKITELQAKIASLEAERELDKGALKQLHWQLKYGGHETQSQEL